PRIHGYTRHRGNVGRICDSHAECCADMDAAGYDCCNCCTGSGGQYAWENSSKKTTFQRCADLNEGNPVPKGRRPTMLTSMDKRTVKLHASGEDYLETILVLQKKLGMVRSVDVARHMEVSKPSVCHAVATLR